MSTVSALATLIFLVSSVMASSGNIKPQKGAQGTMAKVINGVEKPILDDDGDAPQYELTAENQWTHTSPIDGSKVRLTTIGAASPSKIQVNAKQTMYVLKIVKMESKAAGAKQWVTIDGAKQYVTINGKRGLEKDLKAGILRLTFNEVETQTATKKSETKKKHKKKKHIKQKEKPSVTASAGLASPCYESALGPQMCFIEQETSNLRKEHRACWG